MFVTDWLRLHMVFKQVTASLARYCACNPTIGVWQTCPTPNIKPRVTQLSTASNSDSFWKNGASNSNSTRSNIIERCHWTVKWTAVQKSYTIMKAVYWDNIMCLSHPHEPTCYIPIKFNWRELILLVWYREGDAVWVKNSNGQCTSKSKTANITEDNQSTVSDCWQPASALERHVSMAQFKANYGGDASSENHGWQESSSNASNSGTSPESEGKVLPHSVESDSNHSISDNSAKEEEVTVLRWRNVRVK